MKTKRSLKKQWAVSEKLEIVQARQSGLTLDEVKSLYGVSPSAISGWTERYEKGGIAGLGTGMQKASGYTAGLAIQIKDVPGQPGVKQAVFVPVNARQQAMVEAARESYRGIPQALRDAVERQAGEVFERGSDEFSLFLALLNSSRP